MFEFEIMLRDTISKAKRNGIKKTYLADLDRNKAKHILAASHNYCNVPVSSYYLFEQDGQCLV